MSLEYRATRWLKWEKRCPIVITERSPREFFCGKPDVLGITDHRFMLEVEVKRSLSDFKANAKKYHNQILNGNDEDSRAKFMAKAPKQFWFMVPPHLVDKVLPLLPKNAGLMTESAKNHFDIKMIKPSPVNKLATKLSVKECARLLHQVGNQLMHTYEGIMLRNVLPRPCDDEDYYAKKYDYVTRSYVYREEYTNYQI